VNTFPDSLSCEILSLSGETILQKDFGSSFSKDVFSTKTIPDVKFEICNDDDDSSLSTLSGSGIDFFRKMVIHGDQVRQSQDFLRSLSC
jgi:hypothetical protein